MIVTEEGMNNRGGRGDHRALTIWAGLTVSDMLFVLWSSFQPGDEFPGQAWFFDFLHIPVYAGLAFLFFKTLCCWKRPVRPYAWAFVSFVVVFLFGVVNEGVQLHVPGRCFSVHDMLNNALGAGLTLAVMLFRNRVRSGRL